MGNNIDSNKYNLIIEENEKHEYDLKHRIYEIDEGESLSDLIDMSKYHITRMKIALKKSIDDLDKILECYSTLL